MCIFMVCLLYGLSDTLVMECVAFNLPFSWQSLWRHSRLGFCRESSAMQKRRQTQGEFMCNLTNDRLGVWGGAGGRAEPLIVFLLNNF